MLKKIITILLLAALLLPVTAFAEEPALPDGWRVEDFGDFTMPLPKEAIVFRYDPEVDNGWVAEIVLLDADTESYLPYIGITWMASNMSAYYRTVHPLDYAKALTKNTKEAWTEDGITISEAKTIYGQKRGDVFYCMDYMRVEDGGWLWEGPHDIWYYQRYYGNYQLGTYIFEIYAPTRAQVEEIIPYVEQVTYLK